MPSVEQFSEQEREYTTPKPKRLWQPSSHAFTLKKDGVTAVGEVIRIFP